jgi:hypothetical protein
MKTEIRTRKPYPYILRDVVLTSKMWIKYIIYVFKNDMGQCMKTNVSQGSSVSIVSGYGLDDRAVEIRFLAEASVSRLALGPTQPPVQWVPGVLSPGLKRGRGVTLTTHPHPVPRSKMSRSYTSSPPKRLRGV